MEEWMNILIILTIITMTVLIIVLWTQVSALHTNVDYLLDLAANESGGGGGGGGGNDPAQDPDIYNVERFFGDVDRMVLTLVSYDKLSTTPDFITNQSYINDSTWISNPYTYNLRSVDMFVVLSYINYLLSLPNTNSSITKYLQNYKQKSSKSISPADLDNNVTNYIAARSLIESYIFQCENSLSLITSSSQYNETTIKLMLPIFMKYLVLCVDDPTASYTALYFIESFISDSPAAASYSPLQTIYTGYAYILSNYFTNETYPHIMNPQFTQCVDNSASVVDLSAVSTLPLPVDGFYADSTYQQNGFTSYEPIIGLATYGRQFYQLLQNENILDLAYVKSMSNYLHPTIKSATLGLYANDINAHNLILNNVSPINYNYGWTISATGKLLKFSTANTAFFYRLITPGIPYMNTFTVDTAQCKQLFTQYLGLRNATFDTTITSDNKYTPQIGFILPTTDFTSSTVLSSTVGLNMIPSNVSVSDATTTSILYKLGNFVFMNNRIEGYYPDLSYSVTLIADVTASSFSVNLRIYKCESSYTVKGASTENYQCTAGNVLGVIFTYDTVAGTVTSAIDTTYTVATENDFDLSTNYTFTPFTNTVNSERDFIISNTSANQVVAYALTNPLTFGQPASFNITYNSTAIKFDLDAETGQYLLDPTISPAVFDLYSSSNINSKNLRPNAKSSTFMKSILKKSVKSAKN